MLYAARRALTVETSAKGELEPSTVRKMGSLPPVALKRARMPGGVTVMFSPATWQVEQERPFDPRSWKKGLLGSVTGPPPTLMVRAFPDPLRVVKTAEDLPEVSSAADREVVASVASASEGVVGPPQEIASAPAAPKIVDLTLDRMIDSFRLDRPREARSTAPPSLESREVRRV